MAAKESTEQLFSKYISCRKIVIGDHSASARTGLARAMIVLGAKPNYVSLASSLAIATEEIARMKPHVVLCDYDLGHGSGLSLLQAQRTNRPESKDSLFILVTGNTSQAAVAQAAEEDVDTYIVKPYTLDALRHAIMRAALDKVYPSEYQKVIEAGKNQLFSGALDEALKLFEQAMTMHPKPTLACFYRGQVHLLKEALETSEKSYAKGLGFNKIHYKCLTGLYDLFMSRHMFTEAYDVVKRISRYFPANPQRLASVLRLAIMTKSYDDIEGYYHTFTTLEDRSNDTPKYVCAALVVCGKYYLQRDFPNRALELFSKAAITAGGRTGVLREIIVTLMDAELATNAREFLKRFPPETQAGAEYLSMKFLIDSAALPAGVILETGRQLIQSGVHDPVIYKVVIQRSLAAGLTDAGDSLLRTACQKWPQQAQEFQAISRASIRAAPRAS